MKPQVMVIDDLDSARQMVKRALSHRYDVYDFAGVAEALPALDRAEFDCVITDLRMPDIDGLEGLARFHAKVQELPVIIVTAFATVETAVEAMKAGRSTTSRSRSSRRSWSCSSRARSSTCGCGGRTSS